jgi:flagellar biosynthetic protein FlhB
MKAFDPTPARLERARREGDHPISRDAVAVATFCGSCLGLLVMSPILQTTSRSSIRNFAVASALTVIATCAFGSTAAIIATLLQTRGLAFRPLAFRLGFGKIFGRDSLGATARTTLAAAIAALAMSIAMQPRPQAIVRVVAFAAAAGIAHAVLDVLASTAAWRRRLRMTHDELRRDLRESDGDPQTRSRRRRFHRTIARGSLRQVRRASFVVVNPTHVAVALRYVPPQTPVPLILVRAADAGALRVKALAAESQIPVIQDVVLARNLYAHAELGPIPIELYVAVAQIIAALTR